MRKEGYYWCRSDDIWEPVYWNGEDWICAGVDIPFRDEDFDEIDETPLERKPSYTVDIDALGEINIA